MSNVIEIDACHLIFESAFALQPAAIISDANVWRLCGIPHNRHSFASLLLAEGRQPLYVAKQLGHSLAVLLSTYAHLIDEYAEHTEPIDAEHEIAQARQDTEPMRRSAV